MKIVCVGDAMIRGQNFTRAARTLGAATFVTEDWESNWDELQHRRLVVEQRGPSVEPVPAVFRDHPDAEMLLGLFCPFSEATMDCLPNLKVIGVARAGVENVDISAATKRKIAVVNVLGRNAEAVSDFAIGLILCEARNIARSHAGIKEGRWRKQFANSAYVPELNQKTVGIVGFGYIGRLVARKLSGFHVNILVYDPWVTSDSVTADSVRLVDKETLFSQSDFITVHARLTDESRHLVGRAELSQMKPTAYLVNSARSGLIDMEALVEALRTEKIAGAALDVFEVEPLPDDHPLLSLDNVTLTSHIAGTTREALTRSPELLVREVQQLLYGMPGNTLKNPQVMSDAGFRKWLEQAPLRLEGGR